MAQLEGKGDGSITVKEGLKEMCFESGKCMEQAHSYGQ